MFPLDQTYILIYLLLCKKVVFNIKNLYHNLDDDTGGKCIN